MLDHRILAYDYPVMGAFWTVMWIFLWVLWLVLLFRVVADVLRDRDLNGWAKAAWLICMLFIPFLGVLAYVVARGRHMGEREMRRAQRQQEAFDAYVRETVSGNGRTGGVDELVKLSELRNRGDLSETEFQQAKEKILR